MSSCVTPCPQVRCVYFNDAAALYADAENTCGLRYATPGSVGLDLRACFAVDTASNGECIIEAGERVVIPTGIAIEPMQSGIAGFVYSRSGLGAMKGLVVAQGTGVIDPDYRGEIAVVLLNTSAHAYTLRRGERIAQLVFQPAFQVALEFVDELEQTQRGSGGFGHTGK